MCDSELHLNRAERVNRMRSDLAIGLPGILTFEGTQALILPLETVQKSRFDAICQLLGAPELIISSQRAKAVMTPKAAQNLGGGPVRIAPPENADFEWYQTVVTPSAEDVTHLIGPLHVLRDGGTALHEAGLGLIKSAELIPAFALFSLSLDTKLPTHLQLMQLDVTDAAEELTMRPELSSVGAANLPLQAHEVSRLEVFRDPDGIREHYAITIGKVDRSKPVLVRLHSACFTGDVLASLKCDCGPQLHAAMAQMSEEGAGVLLYLNQEGRGIGLANKMRVYALQNHGLDTVEANHHLGYEDDERDFRTAATLLGELGISDIRLLTNNPKKVRVLEEIGINVTERLPLKVGLNPHNEHYLSVKAQKSGHLL